MQYFTNHFHACISSNIKKKFKTVGYAFLELSQRRGAVLLLRLKAYILIAEDYEFSHFIKHSSMLLLPTFSKLQ